MSPKESNQPRKSAELDTIVVKGAREHNLQNIDLELPKKKLIVLTGVSGSGKSSLAFDTIYAEGQRRYVESLSAYARQFIGQMDKPRYDMIRGLSPTIAIEQKAASRNPRSTVGTITEIYDYLRVLFARIGEQYCIQCGQSVGHGNAQAMVAQILELPAGTRIVLMAPIVENRKGTHQERLDKLRREGFGRVRLNGVIQDLDDVQQLPKQKKHTIDVVVDRLVIKPDDAFRVRLTDSVELALKSGQGRLVLHIPGREDLKMSEARSCCGMAYPELEPPLFSFNSPQGMCPGCNGIGSRLTMDPDKLVPDPRLTIHEGAVVPWRNYFTSEGTAKNAWGGRQIEGLHRKWGLPYDTPWNKPVQKTPGPGALRLRRPGDGGLLGFGENPGPVQNLLGGSGARHDAPLPPDPVRAPEKLLCRVHVRKALRRLPRPPLEAGSAECTRRRACRSWTSRP